MKIKPAGKKGKVVVELGARDQAILTTAPTAAAFRLKQILVPVDFSECSRKALRYALPFAKEFGAGISLLHVVETAYVMGEFGAVDYVAMAADLTTEAERQLRELAGAEIGSSAAWKIAVRQGRPATEIAEAARELEADLIVIATHGRTGLKHALLGSVAENVVRHAPCPVLTVRENEREFVES
jgi:nucleotide-binding universal stress UspA family protein